MGHANLSNLSELMIRRLYAHGRVTVETLVGVAQREHETLHASEGEYDDEAMLAFGLEQCLDFHVQNGIIAPIEQDMTPEQKEIWKEWIRKNGCVEDLPQYEKDMEEFGFPKTFDSIPFRFAKGARAKYLKKQIEHLENVTN